MQQETMYQKWLKHKKSGGFLYAVYRGVKYLVWRIFVLKCQAPRINKQIK
jgi:hypothetical protein